MAVNSQSPSKHESEFISLVVHELREPITVVMGLVEALSKREQSDPEVREFHDRIRRQAERAYFLIDTLLDASQLKTGRFRVSLGTVSLADAAEDALEKAPGPSGKTVTLAVPDDLSVVADARRIDQVLINLLTNAYLHGGDSVLMEARETSAGVEVTVSDDGAGVPVELVPDLFKRFARGANATDTPGSGLGLAVAKQLVEAFGGRIWYEPEQPHGACFRFLLRPAVEAGSNFRDASDAEERGGPVPKVLIVEDEPDMRFLLKVLLEGTGYDVLEAHHGAAAIGRARDSRPDLVITDIMMPVMNGRELIEHLRSDPELVEIPILVVSSNSRPHVPGADAAIAKPFLPEEVLDAVRALLERGASRDSS
ncbi:MAG: hybrid sensor histidine kinase/response regulator [Actinomycetota bacterium]